MSIRIGANPIGWSNDDLQEIGGDTPLDTCLAEARQAGVVGMEKGHKLPSDGVALKDKLAEYGMRFVGGWYSTELLKRSARDEFEAARAHIAMTQGAGAEIVIVAETSNAIHGDRSRPLSERPRLKKGDWPGYGAKMTEFAERLAGEGLKLNMARSSSPSATSTPSWPTPSRRCIFCSIRATPVGAARIPRRWRSPIASVSATCTARTCAKSRCASRTRATGASSNSILGMGRDLGVYTVPGDGVIDYVEVFQALKGYSGWVVLEAEQDPKKAPALPYAKEGVAHLRAALKEAGLV